MKERNRVFCSTGVITQYHHLSDYRIILEDGTVNFTEVNKCLDYLKKALD